MSVYSTEALVAVASQLLAGALASEEKGGASSVMSASHYTKNALRAADKLLTEAYDGSYRLDK